MFPSHDRAEGEKMINPSNGNIQLLNLSEAYDIISEQRQTINELNQRINAHTDTIFRLRAELHAEKERSKRLFIALGSKTQSSDDDSISNS